MPRAKLTPAAMNGNNRYMTNGVTISPAIPEVGDKVKVIYDGLLSKSGATHLYAHIGFGNKWDNLYDYPMEKTMMGFEATIPISNDEPLQICFKDCANNWDNNSGMNYSFDVKQ